MIVDQTDTMKAATSTSTQENAVASRRASATNPHPPTHYRLEHNFHPRSHELHVQKRLVLTTARLKTKQNRVNIPRELPRMRHPSETCPSSRPRSASAKEPPIPSEGFAIVSTAFASAAVPARRRTLRDYSAQSVPHSRAPLLATAKLIRGEKVWKTGRRTRDGTR